MARAIELIFSKIGQVPYQLGDDRVDAALAGERELALLENLVHSALCRVLHRDDDFGARSSDKVHCSSHALNKLAGNHPVGKIAVLRHLLWPHESFIDVIVY